MLHYRLLLVFLFMFISMLCACQGPNDYVLEPELDVYKTEIISDIEIEYEEITYTSIMPFGVLSSHPQGGDCWGNFYFQFVTNNTSVRIYDLSSKQMIQKVALQTAQRGFVSNCHCNTVCFGSYYYDEDDEFPLIYVSTGYSSEGYTGVLVYRITRNQEQFSITLEQTIRIPQDITSWIEYILYDEYSYLFYTSSWEIYVLSVPKLSEGDVIIDKSMAIETYKFPSPLKKLSVSRNQDMLYYQGRIIFITGVPQSGEFSGLVILDLENRKYEKIIDFKAIGLTKEPESIFFWNGNLCVAFVDQIVALNVKIGE